MEVFTNLTGGNGSRFLTSFVSDCSFTLCRGTGPTWSAIPKYIRNTLVLILQSCRRNHSKQGGSRGSTTFRRVSGSVKCCPRYPNHAGRLSGESSRIYEIYQWRGTADLYTIFPIDLEWCEPGYNEAWGVCNRRHLVAIILLGVVWVSLDRIVLS